MLSVINDVFRLETADTEYIFRKTKHGHLEHVYYGSRLTGAAPKGGSWFNGEFSKEQQGEFTQEQIEQIQNQTESLAPKRSAQAGATTVAYDRDDPLYCLDTMCLEWSGIGKGDFRYSPAEIKMPDGGFVCDAVYQSHTFKQGEIAPKELPAAIGTENQCASLEIKLRDKACDVEFTLIYTVFYDANVITRSVVVRNNDERPLVIRRLLSLSLDMPNNNYSLVTFDGDWAKEAHRHDRALQYGIYVNENRTGASGNKHNPGFILYGNGASENHGKAYGFNLIYSGNHFGFVERNSHELVRIGIGLSPHCFEWTLNKGECFETPQAVMTFSDAGLNGLSANFHSFVNNHIIPEEWQGKERPVLYNSWEPCFFKFNQRLLLRLARMAKKLGMELFVLDDGWFKGRNHDKAGLGDYQPNRRKFPRGLAPFARKIRKLGLEFGIWFEPEMVNEDSDLYRAHPEWAVKMNGRESTLGRNQLVLDLCNQQVRDYIVESVGKVLDDTGARYVKWDMNRHISEFGSAHVKHSQGEFFHRYILGLYEVLRRIFLPRPDILLESCSSGGNRFDLGMMCFSPQIWTSDNTDPVERLQIQGGLSYLYPQSVMGAHVSDAPHQQTLRDTPLSTRYNVACFGCLGYELDLRFLTPMEKAEIKEQIAFYKTHRATFQYGNFIRLNTTKANKTAWLCRKNQNAIAGFFQTMAGVSEGPDTLYLPGFDADKQYTVSTRPQRLFIKRFGGLVKHILPVTLDPQGFILRAANRLYALIDCVESYTCSGSALKAGIMLNNQFMGSPYNNKTRLLADYGSSLYVVEVE